MRLNASHCHYENSLISGVTGVSCNKKQTSTYLQKAHGFPGDGEFLQPRLLPEIIKRVIPVAVTIDFSPHCC